VNPQRPLLQMVLLRGFAQFVAHIRERGFRCWNFHLVLVSFWYYNIKFTPTMYLKFDDRPGAPGNAQTMASRSSRGPSGAIQPPSNSISRSSPRPSPSLGGTDPGTSGARRQSTLKAALRKSQPSEPQSSKTRQLDELNVQDVFSRY